MYDSPVHDTNYTGEPPPGVVTKGLGKQFGDHWALRELDLHVPAGTVLGLLGHNGAGKTTAIRMLTTLARPSAGTATVAGFDTVSQAAEVRRCIGVAAQQATVDGLLTARANLEMIGQLRGASRHDAREQASRLLAQVDLLEDADKLTKTFSGGMRRRLDLAASLAGQPAVLFLDEPTTGLDPHSRSKLWGQLRNLVGNGTTIVLTTQYLDEADQLADDIVLLDHGRTIAHGTPAALKARIAGDRVVVRLVDSADRGRAIETLTRLVGAAGADDEDDLVVTASVPAGRRLADVLRALDDDGVDVVDLSRHQPSLDDVFLTFTAGTRNEPEGPLAA